MSRALTAEGVEEIMVHTGQHYDPNLSDVFFDQLEIAPPEYHLGVGSGPHGQQTARMLEGIEEVLEDRRPDWVLVFGDTNSTLAGALAAAKLHFPVAHVEAGLRSFNRRMPEEVNRVLTDHASDLLFAPTETAVANLQAEGFGESRIEHVGDVMYDAARFFADRAERESAVLERLGLRSGAFVLATVHRAENTDDRERLTAIFDALTAVSEDIEVVVPLHPRTRLALKEIGDLQAASEPLVLTDPVGYLDMVMLERHARLIVTDSGGVQKEAYFHRTPCVTVRDETEWVELVDLGWNRLAPPASSTQVERVVRAMLAEDSEGREGSPYGTGDSADRIVRCLSGDRSTTRRSRGGRR